MIAPLRWNDQGFYVELLDQTRLPVEEVWLEITTPEQMAEAIRSLRVRGAPAIGIAAAYGAVLALRTEAEAPDAFRRVMDAIDMLGQTRPTAVNLFWALERMRHVLKAGQAKSGREIKELLRGEARAIEDEDREAGLRLGEHGLSLLGEGMTVLTHCHTGGVATSGYGTALAPLLISRERGMKLTAFVDETRPLLQGSRITAWELGKAGVPATLITDSMAGLVMRQGKVHAVMVGADRIAGNGDVANKVGTYSLAVLAHAHGIPFYVSAPVSTFDLSMESGDQIEIEERSPVEITHGFGRQTAPHGVAVYNPAFDITPARYITAIITERGVIQPPYVSGIKEMMEGHVSAIGASLPNIRSNEPN